jgi:hypothetical protein
MIFYCIYLSSPTLTEAYLAAGELFNNTILSARLYAFYEHVIGL